jgi:TRAP-type C4-dicarboxylate transport system substrate-binding protein
VIGVSEKKPTHWASVLLCTRPTVVLAVTVTFLVVALTSWAAPTLRIAYEFEQDQDQVKALRLLAGELENRGVASLTLIPASTISSANFLPKWLRFGADESVLDAVRSGKVDLAIVKYSEVVSVNDKFKIFSLPFLFRDEDHLQKVLFGSQGKALLDGLPPDLIGVGWWAGTFANLESNRTVALPEDLVNKRFTLTMQSEKQNKFEDSSARALADSLRIPVKTAHSGTAEDLWHADQPTLLEGQLSQFTENLPKTPSITLTRHSHDGYVIVANKARWLRLDADFRQHLSKLLDRYYGLVSHQSEEREMHELDSLARQHSAAIFELSPNDREIWRRYTRAQGTLGLDPAFVHSFETVESVTPVSATPPKPAPTWNSWITDDSNQEVTSFKSGRVADLNLDLSRFAYTAMYSAPAGTAAVQDLQSSGGARELYIVPISMDGNLEGVPVRSFSGQFMKVVAANLSYAADDEKWMNEFSVDRLTREELSKRVSIGGQLRWHVRAKRDGCATIAFVVWDAAHVTPLDQVLVEYPVRKNDDIPDSCVQRRFETPRGPAYRVPAEQPMQAGLETFLRGGYDGMPMADIGLSYFESEDLADKISSTVVMIDRKQLSQAGKSPSVSGVYAWQSASSLSRYVSMSTGLADLIARAHNNLSANREHPFADAANEFADVLFAGASPADTAIAAKARAQFKDTVRSTDHPQVVVRLYDASNRPVYLPLRLLAAGGSRAVVSQKFDVVQLLPSAGAWQSTCVKSWHVARPTVLQDANPPAATELLAASRLKTPGVDLLDTHEKLRAYLAGGPVGPQSPPGGEGLLLLAHHDAAGSLSFNLGDRSPPRIRSDQINRQFPPGSIGILIACNTTGPNQETSAITERLTNYGGMDSIIVSTFPVDTEFGVRLAIEVERRVARARADGSQPDLKSILNDAIEKVATADPSYSSYQQEGVRDEGLELQVVGNSNLRLCP